MKKQTVVGPCLALAIWLLARRVRRHQRRGTDVPRTLRVTWDHVARALYTETGTVLPIYGERS